MKGNKRKISLVKVSYDSGSDGDVESDEDEHPEIKSAKKFSLKVKTLKAKKREKPTKQDAMQIDGAAEADDSEDDFSKDDDEEASDDDEGGQEEEGQGTSDKDEGEASGSDDEDGEDDDAAGGGWADAMASILRKEAPEGGSAVLAKSHDYEKAKEEEQKEFMEKIKERQSKKKWENLAKVMPKVTDREFERGLQRIATKGVVQLFNAVRKQQKTREEKLKEVGGSQRKRAKVEASLTKGAFLDLLKGTPAPSKTEQGPKSTEVKKSAAGQPSWGVLRDDFMLGAEMKDWDKDAGSDDDGEDGASDEADSGLSSDSD